MVKSNKFIQAYKKLNLVIYSCRLNYNKKTQKKTISECQSNINMNNYNDDYINDNHNGFLMKMGTTLQDNNILVGLDIDNKDNHFEKIGSKEIEVLNGMDKWINMLEQNNINSIDDIDTPIQQTANNGLHYLFKVNKNDYSQLKTINGLYIDDKKYSIDFKANNQCLIVEPSMYIKGDETKYYKWLKSPEEQPIQYMPLFIYNTLLKSKPPKIIKEKQTCNNIVYETDNELTLYKVDLLNNLNPDRFHNGNDWRFMARLFNNLQLPLELFIEYSKTSTKYESNNDCKIQYNKYNNDSKYNIKTLEYLSFKDDKINHKTIQTQHCKVIQTLNVDKRTNENKYDMITINDRYLIDNKISYNKNQNTLTQNIDKWMTTDIKSLNIKSPYDTGKTQVLRQIIQCYNPKKILFISYRKTLSYDIRSKFNNLGFKSYLNEDLNSDRLIIQIESLYKIRNLDNTHISDTEDEINYYDLIIIDEVESIMNQFSSSTLGDKKKETFNLLDNLLFTCNKIITLDGDMDIRTYDFINGFGSMINIVNKAITHNKKINIMKNKDDFMDMIYTDLNNDKKIAIASMTSNEVETINTIILEKYPNKEVLIYTGLTADEDKAALSNMDKIFKSADVILYSPTITAGVSYDVSDYDDYFDKVYGIICSNSCSSRDFKQQLNRIRKIKDDNIYVLNISPMKNNNNTSFYNFDDVKQQLLIQNDIVLTRQRQVLYIDGNKKVIEKKVLTNYDINYIHNLVEKKNNNVYYFMHNMELLFIKSGYEFNYIDDKKTKSEGGQSLNMILSAQDLTNNDFTNLLEKQQKGKTTRVENLELKKHFIKLDYGLNIIDEKIIKPLYKKQNIYNNIKMILNDKNIKINDDNYTLNKMIKINKIKEIINKLGFTTLNDVINYDTYNENLLNLYNHEEWKQIDILFNNCKNKIKQDNLQTFINKVFLNYGITFIKSKKTILKPLLNKKGVQVKDKVTKQPKFKESKIKGEYETIQININKIYSDLIAANVYTNKLNIDDSMKDLFIFNKDDNIYANYLKTYISVDINKNMFDNSDDEDDESEIFINKISVDIYDQVMKDNNINIVDEKLIKLLDETLIKPSMISSKLRTTISKLDDGIDEDVNTSICTCLFDINKQTKTCNKSFCYNEKREVKTIINIDEDYTIDNDLTKEERKIHKKKCIKQSQENYKKTNLDLIKKVNRVYGIGSVY